MKETNNKLFLGINDKVKLKSIEYMYTYMYITNRSMLENHWKSVSIEWSFHSSMEILIRAQPRFYIIGNRTEYIRPYPSVISF